MPNKPNKRSADRQQPMSAMTYAIISLIGLIVGLALLFFYVFTVPRLVANGSKDQVFYLLLIPWALASAAFLFGAMRSVAIYQNRQVPGVLQLGGPVVLFCLVIVGGFRLVPTVPSSFDLTVRAHSADGKDPVIKSGKVTVDLDNDRKTKVFNMDTGEADFKGLAAKFREGVKILPEVEGFESSWKLERPSGNVLDLSLVRISRPAVHLIGTIIPPPHDWADLRVVAVGEPGEATIDKFGRFDLPTSLPAGERVRLQIFAKNKLVYDDFQRLPGPVELTLQRDETR